ncbi:hypothetical protein [Sphingomonas sp. Root241]|uniref:hypothetical protein n=1 Tax=Sphingomonas sp. Root241 TaxID=1736501 RepID=UPI0012E37D0D|nr:hypothetical protein [Sphingomonas sp. Root241]
MTKPSVIYFGPDGSRTGGTRDRPKIFLRSLLIANSKRGRVIEHLYATLIRQETRQNFNVWVYGDDKLKRGSGLHVSDVGIVTNHHFLLPTDNSEFRFRGGLYTLELYAKLLGDQTPSKLLSQSLEVSDAEGASLSSHMCGLYFDWGPQGNGYASHLDRAEDGPRSISNEPVASG